MAELSRQIVADVPLELQLELSRYFNDCNVRADKVHRADVVLALLRINSDEALRSAEKLLGKPITVCPPAVPPWPPKPPAGSTEPRVTRVGPNPCTEGGTAWHRYKKIRIGMTKKSLASRGITTRDLCVWKDSVEFGVGA